MKNTYFLVVEPGNGQILNSGRVQSALGSRNEYFLVEFANPAKHLRIQALDQMGNYYIFPTAADRQTFLNAVLPPPPAPVVMPGPPVEKYTPAVAPAVDRSADSYSRTEAVEVEEEPGIAAYPTAEEETPS